MTQRHTPQDGHAMRSSPKYHFVASLLWGLTPQWHHWDCPMDQCDFCHHNMRRCFEKSQILLWWSPFQSRAQLPHHSHASHKVNNTIDILHDPHHLHNHIVHHYWSHATPSRRVSLYSILTIDRKQYIIIYKHVFPQAHLPSLTRFVTTRFIKSYGFPYNAQVLCFIMWRSSNHCIGPKESLSPSIIP